MLETVQENCGGDMKESNTAGSQAPSDVKPLIRISDDEGKQPPKGGIVKTESEKHTQQGESGSESAGNKSDSTKSGRRPSEGISSNSAQKPKTAATAKSNYPVGSAKARQESGKQNMTVETETVQSIPQSQLAPAGDRSNIRAEPNGTIKLKPSNETIRPKKERKKADRKSRSVNQGTGMYLDRSSPRLARYRGVCGCGTGAAPASFCLAPGSRKACRWSSRLRKRPCLRFLISNSIIIRDVC